MSWLHVQNDSKDELTLVYSGWNNSFLKRIIPLLIPLSLLSLIVPFLGFVPYPWIFAVISCWSIIGSFMLTGEIFRDHVWEFDKRTGKATSCIKRAGYLRKYDIPYLLPNLYRHLGELDLSEIKYLAVQEKEFFGVGAFRIAFTKHNDDQGLLYPFIFPYIADRGVFASAERIAQFLGVRLDSPV